jgi:hypothetical protein
LDEEVTHVFKSRKVPFSKERQVLKQSKYFFKVMQFKIHNVTHGLFVFGGFGFIVTVEMNQNEKGQLQIMD